MHAILIKYDLAGSLMLLGFPDFLASCRTESMLSARILFIIRYTFSLLVERNSVKLFGFSSCEYMKRIFDFSTIVASSILDAEKDFSIASSSPISFSAPLDFLNAIITLIVVTLLRK